jgi:transposase
MFEQGVTPAEIAWQVGVSHQIVSDWRAAWRRSGRDGLRAAGRAGRLPKLNRDQLALVEVELAKGTEANGYPNDLWTLKRVAEVIRRLTGVSYHPARVWYLLRQGLNWSWQRPARRATERNDEAIHRWVKRRWPQLKKERGARTR